jgi:hypothetical protein
MAGANGSSPHKIVGDQRLPLRVVLNERLEVSLQEIRGNRHLSRRTVTPTLNLINRHLKRANEFGSTIECHFGKW